MKTLKGPGFSRAVLHAQATSLAAERDSGKKADMQKVSAKLIPFLIALAMTSPTAAGAQTAPAAGELKQLLNEFLKAASTNNRAVFDRFFAEDVLYTRASGVTITKADIMRSLDSPQAGSADAEHAQQRAASTYDSENVTVHQYGDMAVVNFTLVARPTDGSAGQHYRNTGTFVKRDGRWQAVAWQATKAE